MSKPKIKPQDLDLYRKITKKELSNMAEEPGSQASKICGCICNIFENRGGIGSLEDSKKYWVMTNCSLHKHMLEKK